MTQVQHKLNKQVKVILPLQEDMVEEETKNKVVKVVNPLLHKHKVVDFYMVVMVEDQANLQEDQAVVGDSTAEVVELMLVDLTELQEGDHHIMVTHR